MSTEKIFCDGVRAFPPHEKAPSWVKGSIVITLNQLVKFCKEHPELLTEYNGEKQIKLQLQESKKGGLSLVVDTYKKEEKNIY
jgi:hypothetical protein